jgi:hypothetical protein
VSHLTDEELERWRDEGNPNDRDRVLGHLASCPDCRERLADLVRSAPAAAAQTSFDPAPFIQRGSEVFAPRRRWSARSLWLGLGGLAIAAASLFIVLRPVTSTVVPGEIRGSELLAISPAGTSASVTEFKWASPFAAPRYRVVVRDAAGAIALQLESSRESASVTGESQAKLVPGAYQWTVDALDATGAVIASSKPQTFTIGR